MSAWIHKYSHFFLLAGIVLIALGLQGVRLQGVSLWYDEYLTTTTVTYPWSTVLTGSYPKELHPPLYFISLKVWNSLLSETELGMRWFSLLWFVGSLILIYFVTESLGDIHTGLGAAFLLAFHPMYVYYAIEIRMYTMLMFLFLLALLSFLRYTRATRNQTVWLTILVGSITLALYTHYFSIMIIITIATISCFLRFFKNDKSQVYIFVSLAICIFLFIPCVYYITLQQIRDYTNTYTIHPDDLLRIDVVLALISSIGLLQFDYTNIFQVVSLLAVLTGLAFFCRYSKVLAYAFIVSLIFCGTLAFFVSSRGVVIVFRYLIHVSIISLILQSFLFVGKNISNGKYLNLARIIIMVLMSFYIYFDINTIVNPVQPNWRTISLAIEQNVENNEVVILTGWDSVSIQYYLKKYPLIIDLAPDLEGARALNRRSYIIVESQASRITYSLDKASVLYAIPEHHIKIIRFQP